MATDIIARGMITEYIAGTNINFTENRDGTVEISASGSISSEDSVARDAIGNHKSDTSNPHNVTPAQIGLGNVDNTSDLDKPISTAVQKAIDNKADKTVATISADGLMSASDKTKLDNADNTYALKSKYEDTTINVGRKVETAVGAYSTAEGRDTVASGYISHAEGHGTQANGPCTHAEGLSSEAVGEGAHAEGINTVAVGEGSHAEGINTLAQGMGSHAGGYFTKALHENEAAYGKYNQPNDDTLFSIGDGTADDARHNAFEITTDGGKLHDKDIAVKDDIPTSLPANGGNADTVDSLHANEIASNPNLLINPDFSINQRGNTGISISSSTWINFFIADRWKLYINNAAPAGTIKRNSDGTITLSMTTAYCDIRQMFETNFKEGYYTLSAKINGEIRTLSGYFTGESELIDHNKGLVLGSAYFGVRCPEGSTITVEWAKLEKGKIATNFTPPNPADEMTKCLRYYEKIEYQTSSGLAAVQWKNDINNCTSNIPFFTKRISSPTITITGNSGWRFVSNTGVININSSTVNYSSANNASVSFALSSATTTPLFGWVDRFSVTIEAEL